jgi:hypothetical protein
MKSVKNKDTQENREFWSHVELVAERVRSSPAYANFKMIEKSNTQSSSNLLHGKDHKADGKESE